MSKAEQTSGSAMRRWALAAVIGLITLLFLGAIADRGWGAALVLGVLAALLLGALFNWLYGTPPPALAEHSSPRTSGVAGTPAGTPAPAATAPAPTKEKPAAPPKPAPSPEEKAEEAVEAAEAKVEAKSAKGTSEAEAKAEPAEDATKSDAEPAPGAAGASELTAEPDGAQPEGLEKPRDGGADNLKEIKGVGPKLEETLNAHGIYHFDQIAAWGPAEVAWMDENLKGFRGRVTRDDWVEQAKVLATGGDTDFSKRVDEGKVY